jgi:uncharacterized protein with HEPN domain
MPLRPDVFLETALLALRRVAKFMGNRSLSDYLADELCQSAVERQLEIAGDALGQLRKLDAVLFGKIPDGDLVVAFRNVLAHGYATLDHRRVYEIASSRAGELLKTLETLLSQMPEAYTIMMIPR